MRVLAVNAGSSTLKLSILEGGVRRGRETLEITEASGGGTAAGEAAAGGPGTVGNGAVGNGAVATGVERVLARWHPVDAIAHRVVHGGTEFVSPVLLDDDVRRRLDTLIDLAPLHLPSALAAIDELRRLAPASPQVACFDTAFHATIPPTASTYALPEEWRRTWPLRRFGFHGLSHAYAAGRAAALSGASLETVRVITCHLGAGASLAAVKSGRSVDTTMGFTPLEGLVMATRSGSVDPGLLLWLETHAGLTAESLASDLEHRAGMVGLCGHADMRDALAAEAAGDERAVLALGVYVHRLRAGIAAMAAAMDGVDVLVFTGGVGERSATIRGRTVAGLGFLGAGIDPTRNEAAKPDAELTAVGSAVRTFVIEAREDVEMARAVEVVLGQATAPVPTPAAGT